MRQLIFAYLLLAHDNSDWLVFCSNAVRVDALVAASIRFYHGLR